MLRVRVRVRVRFSRVHEVSAMALSPLVLQW